MRSVFKTLCPGFPSMQITHFVHELDKGSACASCLPRNDKCQVEMAPCRMPSF